MSHSAPLPSRHSSNLARERSLRNHRGLEDGRSHMRCVIVLFSIFCMFLTADAARSCQLVAFVTRNAAYNIAPQLPNPPISAKAMADLLRKAAFDVIEATD